MKSTVRRARLSKRPFRVHRPGLDGVVHRRTYDASRAPARGGTVAAMRPVRAPLPLVIVAALALFVALCSLGGSARGAVVPSLPEGTWPLQPRPQVVHRFDPPTSAWGRGHRGVDLRGHPGQPVRAAAAGGVRFAEPIAGRGVVVVDHGGVRTTYEPVHAALPVGTRVSAGQVIGHLDVAGSHCFPAACLHWGLLRGRAYLDPLLLVGLGPIRLLPLSGARTAPVRPWSSGARVRLLVGPAQAVGAHVGVDLGGRQ